MSQPTTMADTFLSRSVRMLSPTVRSSLKLDELLGHYDTACVLANGPDESRARYWRQQCRRIEEQLRRRMGQAA